MPHEFLRDPLIHAAFGQQGVERVPEGVNVEDVSPFVHFRDAGGLQVFLQVSYKM